MKDIFLFIFFINLSSIAFAGPNIIGNGGNVLICNSKLNKNIELLDLYEARNIYNLNLIKLKASESYHQILTSFIDKSEIFDQETRIELQNWGKNFENESRFISGANLALTEDSYHLAIPTNCKMEQVIIQREPQFQIERQYTVNKDIWDQLDNFNKASLVLHEVVYRLMIKNYSTGKYLNSIPVRHFVGYAASNTLGELSILEKSELLTSLGFSKNLEHKNTEYLVHSKWIIEKPEVLPEVSITVSIEFANLKTMKYQIMCTYSNRSPITVNLEIEIEIDKKVIYILQNYKKVESSGGSYCAAIFDKGNFAYAITADGSSMIFRGLNFIKADSVHLNLQ